MIMPIDPTAAATNADPYGMYAALAATPTLHRHATHRLWAAASAGAGHCPFKQAIVAAFDGIDHARPARVADREAAALPARTTLAEVPFVLPTRIVAALLGVPQPLRPALARRIGDFAAAIGELPPESLLAVLAREAQRVGRGDAETVAANAIGFLSQAHDATAGLIGNTLLALAAHPAIAATALGDEQALAAFIDEVQRRDPPIQNTRRFAAADGAVAGTEVRAGDAILVLLAAANRDAAADDSRHVHGGPAAT